METAPDFEIDEEWAQVLPTVEYAPIDEPKELDLDPMAAAEYARAKQLKAGGALRLLTLDEIAAMPPPEWLLRDLVLDQSFTVLYGPPGALKSFVALDWSLCIASGFSWQGAHRTLDGGVVYAAGEGVAGMRQRIAAWQLHNTGASSPDRNFRLLPSNLRLLDPGTAERVSEAILAQAFTPRLLVIDTWGRAMAGADENSTSDVSQAIGVVDQIREATGVSVLAIHHSRADGDRERGNTALRAAADQVLKADRDGQGPVTLKSQKIKDGVPFRDIRLEPHEVSGSLVLVPATERTGPSFGPQPLARPNFGGGFF
jgi:hypothetical protein